MELYHYYDSTIGPFLNLFEVLMEAAKSVPTVSGGKNHGFKATRIRGCYERASEPPKAAWGINMKIKEVQNLYREQVRAYQKEKISYPGSCRQFVPG